MSKYRTFLKNTRSAYFELKNIMKPVIESFKGNDARADIIERELETASGIETDFQNPDELLTDKGESLEIYDSMLLDPRIKFALEFKKTLILNVDNKVVAASEDERDIEIAEKAQANLDQLKYPEWNDCLDNLLDSMVYGFKVGEVVWGLNKDGLWGWEKIKFQHSIFFDFIYDTHKNLDKVLYGRNYGKDTEIPADQFIDKFFCMIYPYLKDGNWYGDSCLRESYLDWWSKRNIKKWRNMRLQSYGMPVPVVVYDSKTMSADEKEKLESAIANWQGKQYFIIPGTRNAQGELVGKVEIKFIEKGGSRGTSEYKEALDDIDRGFIWRFLIPSDVGFSEDSTGAYSKSKQLFEILLMVIKQMHGKLESVVNPKIRQFVDANFANVKEYPVWRFDEIDENIEIELLKLLMDNGAIDKSEKWIRSYHGIPELSEKEKKEIEDAKEEARKNMPVPPPVNPNDPKNNDDKKPLDNKPIEENQKQFMLRPARMINHQLKAAPFDAGKLNNRFSEMENDFIEQYKDEHTAESERLIKLIERKKIIEKKDLKAFSKIKLKKQGFKQLMSWLYAKSYILGRTDAIDEIKPRLPDAAQFKSDTYMKLDSDELAWLNRGWIDRHLDEFGELGTLSAADKKQLSLLKDKAFFITGVTEDRILKDTYFVLDQGIRSGETVAEIIPKLREVLTADREKYALTIARTNVADAYNTGRMNFFTGPVGNFIEAYQYSAVMDNRTTEFCEEHDGQIIKQSDPDFGSIIPPNHFNCRSIFIPIMIGDAQNKDSYYYNYTSEFEPFGTNVDVVKPAKGFGG